MDVMTKVLVLGVLAFLLNIPCGMWRARTRKFSWQWIVAIHASIPLIIWARIASHAPMWIIPLSIALAVAGQTVGGKLSPANTTSGAAR